jgi:N4-gp56 family major capsid protein
MAAQAGTGTAGTNQDGPLAAPAYSPGEVLIVGQPLANSAPAPKVDTDLQSFFVNRAFDLAVREPLRDKLVFDQFATVRPTRLTHQGAPVRMFIGEDIDETGGTTPLLENLDVDSVAFGARAVDLEPTEYGRAVSRTRLFGARSMINIDPTIVNRVAFDAGRAVDNLARAAVLAGTQTYFTPNATTSVSKAVGHIGTVAAADYTATSAVGTGTSEFVSTTALQVGISMLEDLNVPTFRNGNYVFLTSATGAQHLKNERDTGGFRYVTARNEGAAGNSIYRGQIGMIEGADVVVASRMPNNMGLLIGADALAKVYANSDGYGENPQTIVAPVVDKLRRFLSWGWLHYVGYELFDVRSVVQVHYSNVWRPAGADNLGAALGAIVPATW